MKKWAFCLSICLLANFAVAAPDTKEAEIKAQQAKIEELNKVIEQLQHQQHESNKTMAAKLFITERAVEMRRAAIMRKLKVRSLAELLDLTITFQILSDLRHAAGPHLLLPVSEPKANARSL